MSEERIFIQDAKFYETKDLYEEMASLYRTKDLIELGFNTPQKIQREINRVESMIKAKHKTKK